MQSNPLNPALNEFLDLPSSWIDVTVVVASHAIHGTYTFYIPVEAFQASVLLWLRPAWVNGFTVMIYPAST